jgi:xylan 1,4-beta-xylosidase
VILGESDPEGCAACSAKENPQNQYRNGPLYGAYTLEVLNNTVALAAGEHINLMGAVTWAFEFEGQPPFAGFRELATNGIDKPVLNAFRMLGLLGNERVQVVSSAALPSEDVVKGGVRGTPDITAMAARKEHELEVLVWNYHDDDVPVPAAAIELTITGLPADIKRGLLEQFRVDSDHSNAFRAWRALGSPQSLSAEQSEQLESKGQLQLLTSPVWVEVAQGQVTTSLTLPRHAFSLLRLSW